jgi:hypothetical protein
MTHGHALRAELGQREAAEQVVRRFFELFASGRLADARRSTCARFEWFGRPIGADEWDSESSHRFCTDKPMRFEAVRSVPGEVLARLAPEVLEALPEHGESDLLWLVDVYRGDALVTVGVWVEAAGRAPLIRRIFDPSEFAARVLAQQGR